MAADELRPCARHQRFQILHHGAFDTADVRDHRAAFQIRKHPFGERAHPGDGRAEDHQIGVLNGGGQVERGVVKHAVLIAFGDGGFTSDEAFDAAGQAALLDGQPQ